METSELSRVLAVASAWPALRPYAVAAGGMVLLVALQLLTRSGSHLSPELHIIVIAVITWRVGPRVGLFSAALSIATDWYLLLQSAWSFQLMSWDAMRLVMLSAVAVLTWLGTVAMDWLAG